MRASKTFLFLATALFFAQGLEAHERTWPGKRLKNLWPEANKFTSKQVTLSAPQVEHLEKDGIKLGVEDKSPTFYFAQVKDKASGKLTTTGIILFVDEYGANGRMEISVGITPTNEVAKIDIWQHSENKKVAQADFLGKLVGKKHGDSFEVGKGYQPVPGAEEASEAVARGVRKALAVADAVFGKGESGKPPAQ
ncbi:MAG: hypothetical protein QME66_08775 [Candidatus Eisenbacteria bacterium]|nr:hypothetical protein [Candidatus Eisenbacteria bacterium]